MTFISYAQNQEDVMLYRALREVKQGFYIDVGAQDPVIDSVTKAFYDRGWHGINFEPSEEYFRKLESERPHDLNLFTAAGREPGVVTFYKVPHTGLSTTNPVYAERHLEVGYHVQRQEVPCTTLDRICSDHGVTTLHFLKIDVEGAEREVLEGFSFETIRPWLVVVEATEPNSDHENFAEWEDLLLSRCYRFVYFDGLNRFYAADEHSDLARHFSCPPNPFDQYITYGLSRTRADLEEMRLADRSALVNSLNEILADARGLRETMAERERLLGRLQEALAERDGQLGDLQEVMAQRDRQLASLEELLAQRDRQLGGLQTDLAKAKRHLKSVRSSISWKITSPLRETRRAAIRIISLFRRPKPASDVGTSAFANSDLAVIDELDAALTEPARLLYRNLREAVALQRRMKGRK